MSDSDTSGAAASAEVLPIGIGTALQIAVPKTTVRFNSALVGADAGRFLIIRAPARGTTPPPDLRVADPLVVRYLHEGTAFGFQSWLTALITQPEPLLFLGYPKSLAQHALRSEHRVDCFLPCRIRGEHFEVEARVLDLSRAGCRCVVQAPHDAVRDVGPNPYSGPVQLLLQLPGLPGEQRIGGTVRRYAAAGASASVGIEFTELDPIVRERLESYFAVSPFPASAERISGSR